MEEGPASRTLQRALDILKDRERLAEALELPREELDEYLAGRKRVPNNVFLAALDVVAGRRRGR